MADALPLDLHKKVAVILDQHESERSVYYGYLTKGTFFQKVFALVNIVKLKNFERGTFLKIDMLACVSATEAALSKKYAKDDLEVLVVGNGVDESFFNDHSYPAAQENLIIFCANFAIRRNIEAALWFAHDIFPNVKARIPDAKFHIVGSWPHKDVLKLGAISGITVVGMVKDIQQYYKKGRVFVAPYHVAAGSPLKMLEAMASGIPIVSTPASSHGLGVTNAKHILIATTPADFSDRVVEVLSSPAQAQAMAAAAKDFVRQTYTWKKIVERLEPQMLRLVNKI